MTALLIVALAPIAVGIAIGAIAGVIKGLIHGLRGEVKPPHEPKHSRPNRRQRTRSLETELRNYRTKIDSRDVYDPDHDGPSILDLPEHEIIQIYEERPPF